MKYGNQKNWQGAKGSRIARGSSEDVVPVDREGAYNEEIGEEPVIDTPKRVSKIIGSSLRSLITR